MGKPIFESQEQNLKEIKKVFSRIKRKIYILLKIIELKNINFSFKENQNLLENINLKLNKNELIAIMGESGDGKTTLANIIMGIIKPDNGEIRVDGKKLITLMKK